MNVGDTVYEVTEEDNNFSIVEYTFCGYAKPPYPECWWWCIDKEDPSYESGMAEYVLVNPQFAADDPAAALRKKMADLCLTRDLVISRINKLELFILECLNDGKTILAR